MGSPTGLRSISYIRASGGILSSSKEHLGLAPAASGELTPPPTSATEGKVFILVGSELVNLTVFCPSR